MKTLFYIACAFFWLLLFYHAVLTVAGLYHRVKPRTTKELTRYPSVALLVPAYNEAVVLADTLDAMSRLEYPGKLDIYVLNDGSTDDTGKIAQCYADAFDRIHHVRVPPGTPKGKARVLNYGISLTDSDYVAVFDADNQPEPDCLKRLAEAAETTPRAVGAVGLVKTLNEAVNFLTRCIALEFSAFQLLMQSGRWQLFQLGSLPGTVMLVRRSAIGKAGGYDPHALAEDADLSLALTQDGGLLPVVPDSVTWEQEPETFRVWFRQRVRWMQGNLYLIGKLFRNPQWLRGRAGVQSIQLLSIYVVGVLLVLYSNVCFVCGLFGWFRLVDDFPFLVLWFESWFVFSIQFIAAQARDKRQFRPVDFAIALSMYFTYSQLWFLVLFRAVYLHLRQSRSKAEPVWDKTVRFDPTNRADR